MADKRRGYEFGTFAGVFTPSILTIIGVVMYLPASPFFSSFPADTVEAVVAVQAHFRPGDEALLLTLHDAPGHSPSLLFVSVQPIHSQANARLFSSLRFLCRAAPGASSALCIYSLPLPFVPKPFDTVADHVDSRIRIAISSQRMS